MTAALFDTSELLSSPFWRETKDGDPLGRELYDRHYSRREYADGRTPALFVGPGEKLVLLAHTDDALFVWRRFSDDSGQTGINCAVFRNESAARSSLLIADAEAFAWARWPDADRLYTYVNPRRIRSTNPGCCFKAAGWRAVGMTKGGHGRDQLVILERFRDPGGRP